ncbi:Copper resistance protein D [Hartmannibacter diazotrophicus]|uniref:Copper resistance protein D n=1 Tax=Hartmannibacter diazotrophicus TaxID=1482074 RepID=A0A2C9D8X9_9HYPH|nr:copper homeostasis membrane protein CopD [Hartmannibacter diazotrophicus]SON56716.1 Copper resistance protein D [Hartmannibacter diazotrophicus]
MIGPGNAMIAVRLATYPAAILVYGTSLFLAFIAPNSTKASLGRRFALPLLIAAAIALAATIAWVFAEAAIIAGGWREAATGGLLQTLVFHTSIGEGWLLRCCLAALTTLAVAATFDRPVLVTFVSGLQLASFALSGHAVMNEGIAGVAHVAADAVHLLAGGAWAGSLIALALALSHAASQSDSLHDTRRLVARYSRMGQWAVALVVASGIANTLFDIGGWPVDRLSPYLLLLAAKITLVLAMIALATRNRFVLSPSIAGGDPVAIGKLRNAALAEAILAVCVLALVAVLGTLSPM